MRYMNAHNGNKLNVAIAQNGIFLRFFAAATYGASGFFGGGPAGAAALGVVAGALEVVAGVDPLVAGVEADDPPSAAARRSAERFRRCSGISVTPSR
jgi:hypothetical protein